METTLSELAESATDELVLCAQSSDENATLHLRRLANLFVDMRSVCVDPLGRGADYTGRSKDYRAAITHVYRSVEGSVDPKRLEQLKNQVRYHVSSIVRERLRTTPGALEEYGFHPKSARERGTDRIRQRRALEEAGIIDAADDSTSHAARLVHGARYLMGLAAEEGLSESSGDAKEYIATSVQQIVEHIPDLVSPPAAVEMSRELFTAVPEGTLRQVSRADRDRADDSLTAIIEHAHELRKETTRSDRVGRQLGGRFGRYEQGDRRAAQ